MQKMNGKILKSKALAQECRKMKETVDIRTRFAIVEDFELDRLGNN